MSFAINKQEGVARDIANWCIKEKPMEGGPVDIELSEDDQLMFTFGGVSLKGDS